MRVIKKLRLRVRSLVRGSQVDRELDEEFQHHVEHLVDEFVASGMSPDSARHAALREMGAIEQRKEECRDARGLRVVEDVRQDVAFALRGMRRSPGFAIIAVVSLALGIGGSTAIFGLWNGLLRAPLPGVHDPGALVILSNPEASGSWNGRVNGVRSWLTYGEFEQLRAQAGSFSEVMATQSTLSEFQTRVEGLGEHVARGRLVSDSFFETLGVSPAIGRLFRAEDDGAQTAVISHTYWERLGTGPEVLGKTLFVGGTALTIIGVTPRGFIGETRGQQPDLWAPLRLQPALLPGRDRLNDQPPDKSMWLHVFGRLKPGVTAAQAEAEANAIFIAGLEAFYGSRASGDRRRDYLDQRLQVQPSPGGAAIYRAAFAQSLTVLLLAVGVLLVMACANLASLLLARGGARATEMWLRLSLGASRPRIIQQMLTESITLATIAGGAAVAVASIGHTGLARLLARVDSDFAMPFVLDGTVVVFVIAATLAAGVLVGGLPAWQVARHGAADSLAGGGRGVVGGGGPRRSGRLLVSLQLALALPLLLMASLLVRTVYNLQRADLGFPARQLLLMRVDVREFASSGPARAAVLRALRDSIREVPGVQHVSYSQLGIFSGGESSSSIAVEGAEAGAGDTESAMDVAGPEYFSTLGVPVLLGREFNDGDGESPLNPVVINEAFARRFFAARNPLGMRITMPNDGQPVSYSIVGVAGDARAQDLRGAIQPRFYLPARDRASSANTPTFVIRTSSDSVALMAAVRHAVVNRRPVPILSAATIESQIAPLVAQDRATAQLALVFGGLALAIAAIGLYGLLAYGVARRVGEIAVRMALGADADSVVAMILRETVALVLGGLVAGGGLAYGASRLVSGRLYGVEPGDPVAVVGATALLLMVALSAAYFPARRAAAVDPMRALRQM